MAAFSVHPYTAAGLRRGTPPCLSRACLCNTAGAEGATGRGCCREQQGQCTVDPLQSQPGAEASLIRVSPWRSNHGTHFQPKVMMINQDSGLKSFLTY